MKRIAAVTLATTALAMGIFAGCSGAAQTQDDAAQETSPAVVAEAEETDADDAAAAAADATASTEVAESADGALFDIATLFTERDLRQVADTADAEAIELVSGQDVTITEEGVYVISGSAEDATIVVDADDSAKVQLVLDGVTILNSDAPAIYVASADKVFITTVSGTTSTLASTGDIAAIGDDNVDGVIFASDDIVLNGEGTLVIESSANGIVGKDDVKVTGGTYEITAANHGIEGKDSVAIAGGTFTIDAGKDGIHAENSDDQTLGYVAIADGAFTITAASDGIEGDAAVQIDGGTFEIQAEEGIEGTYVQINGGIIDIAASDDGINASLKSTAYSAVLEINGGQTTIVMGAGDTDALDSNGDLFINGGTVDITAQFAFDFEGQGVLNGGTVIVNGEQVTEITESMMMGGMGGMGGPMGEMGEMDGPQGEWGTDGGMGGGPRGQGGMGGGPRGQGGMGGPGGSQSA